MENKEKDTKVFDDSIIKNANNPIDKADNLYSALRIMIENYTTLINSAITEKDFNKVNVLFSTLSVIINIEKDVADIIDSFEL